MNGVIDIGTNTIRAVVYDEDMNELFNQGVASKILDYTADGILTIAGVVWLSNVVGTLSVMVEQFAVKPKAFGTAAFRELKNAGEVAAYIKEYTGTEIVILSGEEEAECDYLSLKEYADFGVGIDLGGGSCQIVLFDEHGFEGKSYQIGVKRMKNRFVTGIIPLEGESRAVYDFVKNEIKIDQNSDCLYIFGGTAKALAKLNGNDLITIEQLTDIKELALKENAEKYLLEKVHNRYDTVLVGASVLHAIAHKLGAKELKIMDCSVRKGFILKYCT
ncbi:MAG: hypothetical protein UIM24_04870 [Clostridia bacterium]|nr:hypothetical protein [Clostridia bacterium]